MPIWHSPLTNEDEALLFKVFGITASDSVVVEPEIKIAKKVEQLEKRIEELEKRR